MLGGVQLVLGGKWPGVSVTDRVRRVVPIKAAAGPKEEEHGRCLGIVALLNLTICCLSWNNRRKLHLYFVFRCFRLESIGNGKGESTASCRPVAVSNSSASRTVTATTPASLRISPSRRVPGPRCNAIPAKPYSVIETTPRTGFGVMWA
jgi:hypothetical protein